jgi:hypothetical protein
MLWSLAILPGGLDGIASVVFAWKSRMSERIAWTATPIICLPTTAAGEGDERSVQSYRVSKF